ncbi:MULTISPECIES: RNA polymerase sigma factor [Chryseobacterium]|uniref:Sigma-70 family RNA polymerase sigma factor n=1 Tax=Chryseobacterium gambrini TaxID=373672 RepID=A0AAJ1VKE0_9FLAO|nr:MULTISPECIES: sigma-70 family RNA polymerase sigma factor [Chryseobacterium]NPA08126.1 sigma-70 family RNA polymerase sigma factor [Chlorobiota bacterium]MBL7881214.1 sigma-70 family RNA polymerase sigma factor [Chryseobacterium gambrini]MCY1661982.1 sigma-70 family RNA polymerase sigma factor [Chryseobacterium sp. SL1]MDN4012696.1 sigma-70 family RNA polymerase sigma factor [Chryseobacterium gambrini]MDN4030420.1 sigma-70 family RNA polymerase sigma factor [Chryseobacterium gambrini]
MKNLEENFKLAKKQDRRGQKALYEMFSAKMLAIANSYVNNLHDAEDILMNSFFTCFSKIEECREWKSFQFWLRKIVVNNSINFIRKNRNILYTDVEISEIGNVEENWEEEMEELNMEEIFSKMPDGYRLIFNLYVFEEKKHHEIAEILNISEGTSKSQLSKSKKWIADFLKQKQNEKQYVK